MIKNLIYYKNIKQNKEIKDPHYVKNNSIIIMYLTMIIFKKLKNNIY